MAQLLAQDAPHLVIYHFVVEGSGFVDSKVNLQIELKAGDVVVVTHGASHEMCSAVGVTDKLSDAMKAKLRSHDLTAMQAGGGGDVARLFVDLCACALSKRAKSRTNVAVKVSGTLLCALRSHAKDRVL